jgi:hypothetical protein
MDAKAIGAVAARIYSEVANGRIVTEAIHRLRRSRVLLAAVQSANPSATQRTLVKLMKGQIVRVSVLRGSRVLASAGDLPALAPVSLPLTDAAGERIGRLILSTQASRSFLDTVAQVTDSDLAIFDGEHRLMSTFGGSGLLSADVPSSGPVSYRGETFEVSSFAGMAFPHRPLRIVLLSATDALSCASSSAQTVADVLGMAGQRIYREEQSGSKVERVIAEMERSHDFLQAVASRNPVQTRKAIIGFFRNRAHIVRVRVILGGRLLIDVGGPHVLAPVAGSLHLKGRLIGRFLTSIQDDAGYLQLAHEFTGAQVLMRVGGNQVASTLGAGSSQLAIPNSGEVSYDGRTYEVYSFNGRAFPAGVLRISLLFGSGRGKSS